MIKLINDYLIVGVFYELIWMLNDYLYIFYICISGGRSWKCYLIDKWYGMVFSVV